MSEEINKTLKGIHQTLALIHREMVINNLPQQLRDIQREYYSWCDSFASDRRWRDMYEEKMNKFASKHKTCMDAENDLNYISAKKEYDRYESYMNTSMEHCEKFVEKGAIPYNREDSIDMGDYHD